MQSHRDNVVLLRSGYSFLSDPFVPPILPPLLELRKTMGLTLDEAASVMHISTDSLQAKESLFEQLPHPYSVSTVKRTYLFYLSLYGERRFRNIIRDHLTLYEARRDILHLDHQTMGSIYGGYTARQWYNFETHEAILPRATLALLDQDVYTMQTRKF
jgi:hypothetical protein